jgi:hypothetical protein
MISLAALTTFNAFVSADIMLCILITLVALGNVVLVIYHLTLLFQIILPRNNPNPKDRIFAATIVVTIIHSLLI